MRLYEMPEQEMPTQRGLALLAVLGIDESGVRLRDGWVEFGDDGAPIIVLATHHGGGHRYCYCDDLGMPPGTCTACIGERLAQHPLAISDEDGDGTERTYQYRAPAGAVNLLTTWARGWQQVPQS